MEFPTNRTHASKSCNDKVNTIEPVRLMVSVRNLQEAMVARRAHADIIDLKEPSKGTLGPVSPNIASRVQKSLGEASRLSIALGELSSIREIASLEKIEGYHFAKVGLSQVGDEKWENRLKTLLWSSPVGTEIIPVAYADWRNCGAPCPKKVMHFSFENDVSAFVIDTFDKSRGDLFDYCSMNELHELLDHCRCADLVTVIAGSISHSKLGQTIELRPDYIGARGAFCHRERSKQLAPELLEEFQNELRGQSSRSNSVSPISDSVEAVL